MRLPGWIGWLMVLGTAPIQAEDVERRNELLPTVCPAIAADDYLRIHGKSDETCGIELVVVGTVDKIASNPVNGSRRWSLNVEKCLYGDPAIRSLSPVESCSAYPPAKGRGVFVLGRRRIRKRTDWAFRHVYDMVEEQWQTALAAARLDFVVLSSSLIFVGRADRTATDNNAYREAAIVVRPLEGGNFKAGERVTWRAFDVFAGVGSSDPQEGIYLLQYDRKRPGDFGPPDYRLAAYLPMAREADVRAALLRRNEYPVVNTKNERKDLDWADEDARRDINPVEGPRREIVFRGAIDDAAQMLRSSSSGVRLLAQRTIRLRGEEGRSKLLAGLDADLLAEKQTEYGQFGHLRACIAGLEAMGEAERGGAIHRSIARFLDHVEKRKVPEAFTPPPSKVRKRVYGEWMIRGDYFETTSPHVLRWLMETLSQEDAVELYGRRLLSLRTHAPQPWRDALQEAADATQIEESLALSDAWARMRDLKPVQTPRQPRHSGHNGEVIGLAFVDHDKTLLSWASDNSICRWDAESLTLQSRVGLSTGWRPVNLHGPAGHILCEENANCPPQKERWRGWRDEKASIENEPRSVGWLYDFREQRFVAKFRLPTVGETFWLNDQEYLLRVNDDWRRTRAADGQMLSQGKIVPKERLGEGGPPQFAVTEDGLQLWSLQGLGGDPRGSGGLPLRIFDAKTFRQLCERELDGFWSNNDFGLVPSGKFFCIGTQIFDRRDFRRLHDADYVNCHLMTIDFSPEGSKYAAISQGEVYIAKAPEGWGSRDSMFLHVHETASGRLLAVIPLSQQSAKITAICFSADAKRLAVAGDDGSIAIWNLPR